MKKIYTTEFLHTKLSLHVSKLKENDPLRNDCVGKFEIKNKILDINSRENTISKLEWNSNNNVRIQDQQNSMLSTNVYKNNGHNSLFGQHIAQWVLRKYTKPNIMNETYIQYIFKRSLSFSLYLTTILFDKMDLTYDHYNEVHEYYQIGNKSICDEVSKIEKGETDMLDCYIVSDDFKTFTVVSNNKFIKITLKDLNLNQHIVSIPDLDIQYRRWSKIELNQKSVNRLINNLNNLESNYSNKGSIQPEYLYEQLSSLLKISVEDYKRLLLNADNKIYQARNGRLVLVNDLNKFRSKFDKPKIGFSFSDGNKSETLLINGVTVTYNSKLKLETFFFCGENEKVLVDLMNNSSLPESQLLIDLFSYLSGFQPIKLSNYTQDIDLKHLDLKLVLSNVLQVNTNKDNELLYSISDSNLEYMSNVTFGFSKIDPNKNIGDNNFGVEKSWLKDKSKQIIILEKNKPKVMKMLDSWYSGKKLNKKEIKYLSNFYSYSSTTTLQKSNIKIRGIIEIINDDINKYKDFITIIKLRYGGLSCIICCLFIFLYHLKFTDAGITLITDYGIPLIKDCYWISRCKKLSDYVKTNNYYFNHKLTNNDFESLQYIDMFIGPLINDGKNSKQIVSQRIYDQHEKELLLNLIVPCNNVLLANILAQSVYYCYWKKVITEYNNNVNKEELFKDLNFKNFIKLRQMYATDSSSGGLIGQLSNKGSISKSFEKDKSLGFSPKQATKKDAFVSESDSFFIRSIFSPPVTFCDMVMKLNEKGKYRYIYSVTSGHYLINSAATLPFERYLNHMGVKVVLDETQVVTHVSQKFGFKNCIDYSEFNDQHEEHHKSEVYKQLGLVLNELKPFGSNTIDFELCVSWLEKACHKMIIRVNSNNNTLYQHKGRLFSGERSTTIINSIMSCFYYLLIYLNCYIYQMKIGCGENASRITLEDEISNNFNEYMADLYFSRTNTLNNYEGLMKLFDLNECLGDDGRTTFDNLYTCNLFNEMAIFSGLMLKIQKCLVGVNISEFLRRVETKQLDYHDNKQVINNIDLKNKVAVSKGYPNRAITSLVSGNPEGAENKNYVAWISQIQSSLHTLKVRSNHSELLTKILEGSWKFISKLNRKNKEKNNRSLPNYILYIPKSKGGMGIPHFDNLVYKLKRGLPKLPNPKEMVRSKHFYDVPTKSIDVLIDNVLVPPLMRYGEPNPKEISSRKKQEKLEYISSCNASQNLYSPEFLDKYCVFVDAAYDNLPYVEVTHRDNVLLSYNLKTKAYEFFKGLLNGSVSNNLIVKQIEKLENFGRNIKLIKLKHNIEDVFNTQFGADSYNLYRIINLINDEGFMQNKIEIGQFNLIFSMYLNATEQRFETIKGLRSLMNEFKVVMDLLFI